MAAHYLFIGHGGESIAKARAHGSRRPRKSQRAIRGTAQVRSARRYCCSLRWWMDRTGSTVQNHHVDCGGDDCEQTAVRQVAQLVALDIFEMGELFEGAVSVEDLVERQAFETARTEVLDAERTHDAAEDHRPAERGRI
jgi:hypothetical protein